MGGWDRPLTDSFNCKPDGVDEVVLPADCCETNGVDELVEEGCEAGEGLDDDCSFGSHGEGEDLDCVRVSRCILVISPSRVV